ncbi:hypothetical protein GW17_00052963 [Ensete ventricosum]|nr:hypothetical protein GW17_00052963 [Ensete ventricosum]
MRLRLAAYGRPACGRRLMRLPPTCNRPNARHGPSATWPTLLLVRTLSAAAGRFPTKVKRVGTTFTMPPRIPPRSPRESSCMEDCRIPVAVSDVLQVERGVGMTSLQLFNSVSNESTGFTSIVNTPLLFVIALDMTLLPHCSSTVASAIDTKEMLRKLLEFV